LKYQELNKIDTIVWDSIQNFISQPRKVLDDIIRVTQRELEESNSSLPKRIKELELEYSRIIRAEDRLLDAYAMSDIEQDDLKRQMPKIKLRKSQIKGELDSLKVQAGYSAEKNKKILNLFSIKSSIKGYNYEEQRELLRNVIDKVIVYKEEKIDIITIIQAPDEQLKLDYAGSGP